MLENNEKKDSVPKPIMVGTKDWTMTKQPVKMLLGGGNSAIFTLDFHVCNKKLPKFCVTTLPVNLLFWQLVEEDKSPNSSEFIAVHRWNNHDESYWEELQCSKGYPISIHLGINPSEPDLLKVQFEFEHKQRKSDVYKYPLCPIQNDAYIMFLSPWSKFSDEDQCNPLSLLHSTDFLYEYFERLNDGNHFKKIQKGFQHCCICISNPANIIIVPCGHAPLCSECYKSFKDSKCPYCSTEFTITAVLSQCTERCHSCPEKFKCNNFDCMLIPCGCVVGCFKYTKRAIHPKLKGGEDRCPMCEDEVEELQKVFIQIEGN